MCENKLEKNHVFPKKNLPLLRNQKLKKNIDIKTYMAMVLLQ